MLVWHFCYTNSWNLHNYPPYLHDVRYEERRSLVLHYLCHCHQNMLLHFPCFPKEFVILSSCHHCLATPCSYMYQQQLLGKTNMADKARNFFWDWVLESSFPSSVDICHALLCCVTGRKESSLSDHFSFFAVSSMPKTVAVIGAGPSGLAAIKCSLDAGLKPIAFESDPWLGGTWKYTDLTEETERRSCVAYSTITNTSKHMSCYSDFPMPKEFPNYLPRQKYLEYFQMYADRKSVV